LSTRDVQPVVRETVGVEFGQAVTSFQAARDLVRDLENYPEARHPVLIELADADASTSTEERRALVVDAIRQVVSPAVDPRLESLKRYLAAHLSRREIELLKGRFDRLTINRIWRDSAKRALIYRSCHTIQARPAALGYGATGQDITWAILDTGIARDHPHFAKYANIKAEWDCTHPGAPLVGATDRNGHGTHVAGIVAGESSSPATYDAGKPPELFSGMAPAAGLHIYKVLDDNGDGSDSSIIKALDHIADANESAGRLVIHGINLSLGGSFDPDIYGCGHSPLCQELRRLWRQGVLVCMAAGNEGYTFLETAQGQAPANMDLSIGDPANLDEAIAVGSVHRDNPFTYGISYFSSRGPTADGRCKPDLIAPGERIWSASHRFHANGKLYVEMSGTSMAAPHVSGLLACFLSLRREFIGYPDKVKQILLDNCTDLGRDPYAQGRGLPNLIRMLVQT
jgi:subtilisin family serine protease